MNLLGNDCKKEIDDFAGIGNLPQSLGGSLDDDHEKACPASQVYEICPLTRGL